MLFLLKMQKQCKSNVIMREDLFKQDNQSTGCSNNIEYRIYSLISKFINLNNKCVYKPQSFASVPKKCRLRLLKLVDKNFESFSS